MNVAPPQPRNSSLFEQIPDARFADEDFRTSVCGPDAEDITIVVAHITAHLLAIVQDDDHYLLILDQLFEIERLHAGAFNTRRRRLYYFFLLGSFWRVFLLLFRLTEFVRPNGLLLHWT